MSIEKSNVRKVLSVNMSRVYHSWNAVLNRNAFRFDFKMSTDSDCLMNNGALFHSAGSHTTKALSRYFFVFFLFKRCCDEERTCIPAAGFCSVFSGEMAASVAQ